MEEKKMAYYDENDENYLYEKYRDEKWEDEILAEKLAERKREVECE